MSGVMGGKSSKNGKNAGFKGKWRIFEMELWDKDFFDMEVKAYIEIKSNMMGDFQFGLVSGGIDGKVVDHPDGKRFEFTWDGNDECDPASGSGWVKLKNENQLEGEFRFHLGDWSTFSARKVKR